MFDLINCIILFMIVLSFLYVLWDVKRPHNFPPGPRWLPIVGNSPSLKRLSIFHGGFHKALDFLSSQYKTNILGLKLGADLFVVVFSRDLIKQVLTQDEFQARPDSYFIRLRTMGSRKGITMTDGNFWLEQRNFAVKHLRSLGFGKSHMESLIIEELQDLIELLKTEDDIDFNNHLAPCAMNVLWALTAGSRFKRGDSQLRRLLELMIARSKAFDMAGGILSQLPFLSYLAPEWSGYNIICLLNKELKELLDKTIQEHKYSLDMKITRDFIDAFLHKIETLNGDNNSFTEDQLAMVCLDFFIAGSQTTSNTLSFALLNMLLNQDIQHKVYKEIKEVLGHRKIPSLEDREKLSYVDAVLLESQRCFLVTPIIGPRRVLSDTTLGSYSIPKNTTVLVSLYSYHYDGEHWKDPKKFNPDRFLSESTQHVKELYQFGLGKRRCLGETLAKQFIFLFFVGILRNFHITAPHGTNPPTTDPIPGITLSPKPYRVHLSPRKD